MTQRIFDVDNPQDVKDLFNILPNNIVKIKWMPTWDDKVGLVDNRGLMSLTELFCIAFHNQTVITRPVGETQWIGKLCWFWMDNEKLATIGILGRKTPGGNYQEGTTNECYPYCRPVRRDEVGFVEDEK